MKIETIEDLSELVKRGHGGTTLKQLLVKTFSMEYCLGCSIPDSYPDGMCKGCRALTDMGLSLGDVMRV